MRFRITLTELVAVDVGVLSYRRLLGCSPGPKFGAVILRVTLQPHQRHPIGMEFPNKSQLLSDNTVSVIPSVMSFLTEVRGKTG